MLRKLKLYVKSKPKIRGTFIKFINMRGFLDLKNIRWYYKDLDYFRKKQNSLKDETLKFKIDAGFPCLGDKNATAGSVNQYLIQDLWAAKKIYLLPLSEPHYDIGSRIDGFITELLSFGKKVTLIDIRPLPYTIDENLAFVHSDATNLSHIEDNSLYSLSALCSIEHFGLGRYGDAIDPEACFKAFQSIQRVIKPEGRVYISLPIGQDVIQFNAHRIFNPKTIVKLFKDMNLIEFSIATANNKVPLIKDANIEDYGHLDYNQYSYFGLFEFEKKKAREKGDSK